MTCVARSLGLVDLASRVIKTPTCFLALHVLARLFVLAERILDDVPFPRIMAESVWVMVNDAGRPGLCGCLRPLVPLWSPVQRRFYALALTMRRRWSRMLNAGKEDQVVSGALGFATISMSC